MTLTQLTSFYFVIPNSLLFQLEDDMTARLSLPSVHLPFVRTSVFSQPSYLSPEGMFSLLRFTECSIFQRNIYEFACQNWTVLYDIHIIMCIVTQFE